MVSFELNTTKGVNSGYWFLTSFQVKSSLAQDPLMFNTGFVETTPKRFSYHCTNIKNITAVNSTNSITFKDFQVHLVMFLNTLFVVID